MSTQRGKGEPAVENKVDGQTRETSYTFLDDMNAIAYGIEAKYELITGHSSRVTEETVAIARRLGVPEDEIERWAASRLIYDTEKVWALNSLFERLQGNSLAALGMGSIQGKRLRSQSMVRRECKTQA